MRIIVLGSSVQFVKDEYASLQTPRGSTDMGDTYLVQVSSPGKCGIELPKEVLMLK